MHRFFQQPSDAIAYDGSNECEVTLPVQPSAPCAIIGIEAVGTSREFALRNEIIEIKVGGRRYTGGDPFLLGLLSPTPPGASDAAQGMPYFPGEAIPLPDGRRAGAIRWGDGEEVRIRIKDLTAGTALLTQLVLHCVEFPENCADSAAMRASYARLRAGIGEVFFYGHRQAYDAAGRVALSADPKQPNITPVIRRVEVRGAAVVTAGAAVAESDFRLLKAQLYTNTNKAPHNGDVPARAIIGHGALQIPGSGQVDMQPRGRAIIDLAYPTPAASRTAYLLQVFEGRERGAEMLQTSRAVSS